tara:strand:+ start:143 stop:283 length:141 start_codon:yes stop_codon:yes gene_type:complete
MNQKISHQIATIVEGIVGEQSHLMHIDVSEIDPGKTGLRLAGLGAA